MLERQALSYTVRPAYAIRGRQILGSLQQVTTSQELMHAQAGQEAENAKAGQQAENHRLLGIMNSTVKATTEAVTVQMSSSSSYTAGQLPSIPRRVSSESSHRKGKLRTATKFVTTPAIARK
eukprot:TRINITY_DN1149_c0_g2_i1.p1 TRINITY_DN1149_c0_g2~~TRINITY_DN1149_c0_g2_i1.p1  ORF type:complete len:122 (+),score=15.68 TRINITY_DN1149_c0_g2_i1:90-455(+)